MARIRTIKPEAFVSESLAEVSLTAERTFFGLLTQVDDSGRTRDNAAVLHGAIWPLRPTHGVADVEEDLQQLEKGGLVCRYHGPDGKRFLHLPTFGLHQKISHPTPTKLPPCPSHDGPEGGSKPDSGDAPDSSGKSPEGSGVIPDDSGTSAVEAGRDAAELRVDRPTASHGDVSGTSPEPSGNSPLARARACAPEVEREVEQGKEENPYGAVPLFAAPPSNPDPETASPPEEAKGKTTRKRAVGTRIPDDFHITEEMRAWGRLKAPHVNGEAETEEFIDYWKSVPGAKGEKADWVATWHNRMRELEKRALAQLGGERNGNGSRSPIPPQRQSATAQRTQSGMDLIQQFAAEEGVDLATVIPLTQRRGISA